MSFFKLNESKYFIPTIFESLNNTKALNLFNDNAPSIELINSTSSQTKEEVFNNDVFFDEFRRLIYKEDIEFGYYSKTCEFVEKELLKDKISVLNVFLDKTLKFTDDKYVLFAILHTISHLDYALVYPNAQYIPMAMINHKDLEIKDYAIQCFEIWESKDSLAYLKDLELQSKSLQSYLTKVIKYIEEI